MYIFVLVATEGFENREYKSIIAQVKNLDIIIIRNHFRARPTLQPIGGGGRNRVGGLPRPECNRGDIE